MRRARHIKQTEGAFRREKRKQLHAVRQAFEAFRAGSAYTPFYPMVQAMDRLLANSLTCGRKWWKNY